MAITDLIPWKRPNGPMAMRRSEMEPFSQLHREIDRVFSDFMTDWPSSERMSLFDRRLGTFMPDVDVTETDKEFRVTAELPGIDDKDIEVSYFDGGAHHQRRKTRGTRRRTGGLLSLGAAIWRF